MKPSFALDFRDGVIALLHRTTRGWQQVGATAFDAPDLTEALSYMRSTALGLSPRGLSTKLVIPNDQILYTQVHAPGPDLAKRRKQIKAGLEGLTPYDVDDLVYDWWGNGPDVHVAVVARETLAEAEAFAVEHRLNPVSFVSAPDDASYGSEPFFGASSLAASLLAEGEKVERDKEPISVVAREFPKSEAPAERSDPVAVEAPPVSQPLAADLPTVAEDELANLTDAPPLLARMTAADEAEPATAADEVTAEVSPVPQDAVRETVAEKVTQVAGGNDPLPDFSSARAPAAGVASFDPAALARDLVDEAPMAVDVSDDPVDPPVRTTPKPYDFAASAEDADNAAPDGAARSASAIIAAFASRRTAELSQPVTELSTPTTAAPTIEEPAVSGPQSEAASFAEAAALAKAKKTPAVGPAPMQRPSVSRPALAKPAAPLPSASRNALPFPGRSQPSKFAPAKSKAGVTAASPAGPRRERNVVPLAKPAAATNGQAAEASNAAKGLTGLDGRPLPTRGRPRYLGLILTGLLLLSLAAVAAWSSFYLSSNEVDPNAAPATNAVASASVDPDTQAAPETLPTAEDEAAADGEVLDPAADGADVAGAEAATEPDLQAAAIEPEAAIVAEPEAVAAAGDGQTPAAADETAAVDAGSASLVAPAPETADVAVEPDAPATSGAPEATTATVEPDVAADLAAEQAATAAVVKPDAPTEPGVDEAVAAVETAVPDAALETAPATSVATDAAEAVLPGNDLQDEIFLAAADTPPQTSDPLVMPQVIAGSDPPPDIGAPPPPFGTVYTFDAEGRIQPTPEGIMTPEGVLLVAGAPKVVPPERPAALVQVEPAPVSELPAAAAPVVAVEAVVPDPALAGKKPRPRPAGLVDPGATADQQGEVLAPAPGSRFAGIRPQTRPAALTQTATVASEPSVIVNEAAAASLAANGVQSSTSVLAVAVSRKPAARPSGMDQAVDAAVAAAVSAPEPQAETLPQAASLAPEEQAEPEAEAPAPNLPTNASVARQATVKDALNLSKVSLLGIFGTSSGRYALVRQSGGGVKKIVVGDTIDGGKVAAISATAVQYQKGGRMLTLAMPQG